MKLVKALCRAGSPSFKASLISSSVAPAVGRTTRVCAYDCAGQGWGDDPPHAQDGREAAADLHTLLDRAGRTVRSSLPGTRPAAATR